MPQADKSAPSESHSGRSEFEGKSFPTSDPASLELALRYAFDYRGDVTLDLKEGRSVEGFVHNFNIKSDTVHLFVAESKRESSNQTIKASEISCIRFTGPDTAFGKSWDDWMAKSERQREAEAQRIADEAVKMGHL
ncbi:MAG: hypothetical protein ACFCUX_09790 [Candidatus Methylacidiphilales bacterium]